MSYTPSQARRPRQQYSKKSRVEQAIKHGIESMIDDPKEPTDREQLSLSMRLLAEANPPRLGRPPEGEDEKRLVLRALCYLKAANMTNAACASELNVSERTVATYLKEEAYGEIQQELFAHSRQAGYTSVGAMVSSAMEKMYQLMEATSEFVQFKSAEYILKMAGYEQPVEGKAAESRDEVIRFLEAVRAKDAARNMVVNITVNQEAAMPSPHGGGPQQPPIVDALPTPQAASPLLFEPEGSEPEQQSAPSAIPDELAPYYMPVLPGGRLPWPQDSPEVLAPVPPERR